MIVVTVVQKTSTFCSIILMTVSFIFIPAAVGCTSILRRQELDRAVAEIGDWEALCEYLGVHEAILNNLRDLINTDNTVKKHRCLEAYINTGRACWEHVVEVVADYPFYNARLTKEIANMHIVHSSKNEL